MLGCVCVCACEHAWVRGQHPMSSSIISQPTFWDRLPHWAWSTNSARLSCQQTQESSCLCLPRASFRGMSHHTWGCWGCELGSSSLGKLFLTESAPQHPSCSSKPMVAHDYFVFNILGWLLRCKNRFCVNTCLLNPSQSPLPPNTFSQKDGFS